VVAPAYNLTVMKPWTPAINASTGLTSGPNLLTPQPGEKAALAAAASITLDLGAARDVQQFFLGYTDLAVGANTVRVRAGNTASMATGVLLDSGAVALDAIAADRPAGYQHWFYHHEAGPVQARYVRFDTTSNTARTAGIVAAGPVVQPEFNADYNDTNWGYEEPDDPELLDSGVEVLTETIPAPVFEFRLTWLSEAEMFRDWEPLGRLAHLGIPVLTTRRPDPHDYRHNGLFWGRLRLTPITAADFDMHEVNGRVRSMV
jgi:hypothetical protein